MKTINDYRRELRRAAWRLQYHVRNTHKRECAWTEDKQPHQFPFDRVERRILVQQLLDAIESDLGRKVIHGLFIQDLTEAQLAQKLNISQQAVNKWKRKTLRLLSQKMSS